jgi:hypothetical protein
MITEQKARKFWDEGFSKGHSKIDTLEKEKIHLTKFSFSKSWFKIFPKKKNSNQTSQSKLSNKKAQKK